MVPTYYTNNSYADPLSLVWLSPDCPDPVWEIAMRNKIKADRVNMADTIGEWRETANAVSGGCDALRNAWQFVRKLRRTPRNRWPQEFRHLWDRRETLSFRDIPSAYLVTIFGISPWLTLASDAVDALRLAATHGVVKKYSVTKKTSKELSIEGDFGGECKVTVSKRSRAQFIVRYKPNLGEFTAGNIGEAMWAGVPISFMVDWFIGIGSWLSAIDAMDGVQSVIGTVTSRETRTAVDNRAFGRPTADWTHGGTQTGLARTTRYQRTVHDSIGLPLYIEHGDSATFGKLITSLAILYEMRRS
jgi:hypothetical protein